MNKLACIFLFTLITIRLPAQLCQGSLGDPIVNITFGAGANPGAPIAAAATGYVYVPDDCPNDGFYTVRGNSTSCFNDSWHTINSDHTGNSGGYFMLVNGSIQPSAFYLDTVRGLCGNSTYEFAAWIMNVIRPESCSGNSNQPNLTFRIEATNGTVLQTYNSGNIPPTSGPVWNQYGFYFTTPSTIPDIVLRIVNNAAGGCGNDLALDDITFRPCGPLLTPSIVTQLTTTVALCQGVPGSFNFTCQVSGGFTNPAFQWQESSNGSGWTDIAGQTNIMLTRSFSGMESVGTYAFRLAVAESGNMSSVQCRIVSSPLTVRISANPVTTAINNGPVCINNVLTLTATGGSTYQWTGPLSFTGNSSPLSLNITQSAQAGKYYVLVKNNDNCQHLDSTIVVVNPSPVAATSFQQGTICPGDSLTFSASGGLSYEWTPSAGLSSTTVSDPHASPASNTTYVVTVSNSFDCTDTASVDVIVLEPPHADAGPDKSIMENESVQLNATATGGDVTYYWSPSAFISNPQILQPVVNPPTDTKFIFNTNSANGCGTDSDTMEVFVYKQVYVPGAFTPNGDGLNDSWFIPALSAYKDYELSVFNRYGEMVFHSKNDNKPWDGMFKGKRVPVGAYAYIIDFKRFMPAMKGTVLILK